MPLKPSSFYSCIKPAIVLENIVVFLALFWSSAAPYDRGWIILVHEAPRCDNCTLKPLPDFPVTISPCLVALSSFALTIPGHPLNLMWGVQRLTKSSN